MVLKINIRKVLIYLFSLFIVLPYFSSNIGISFGKMKVNIADIIILIYLVFIMLKNKTKLKFEKETPEIKGWVLIFALFTFLIPLGLLNGATFSEQLRLLRNLLYIIISYYILIHNGKNIDYIFLLEFIAIISSLDCIMQTYLLHNSSNWYLFYRANGVLNVFLFCFLIFKIWTMTKIQAFLGVISCIGLLYSSFLSQERTQLLTIIIAIIISFLYKIYLKLHNFNNLKINKKFVFRLIIFIILFSFVAYYVFQLDFVKNYVDYYLTYRLANGNLFKGSTLKSDGSFSARLSQFKTIIHDNMNPLYILCGKGTCAHYMATQGDTYIVDSAVLWIFKDLGIMGILLIISIFKNLLKGCKKIEISSRLAVYASGISLIIFSIYNPSFVYTSSVAYTFGLYSFLKYYCIKENKNHE